MGNETIGNWTGLRQAGERYGHCDTSYEKAAKFLGDGPVEDWGCGGGYARRFFNNRYVGIDGTGDFCDIVADLRVYTSHVKGILLRHVLEHNTDWRMILSNALQSCEKLCLIIYTPFVAETFQAGWAKEYNCPDICFRKSDITDMLPEYAMETVPSPESWGDWHYETLFYITTGLTFGGDSEQSSTAVHRNG